MKGRKLRADELDLWNKVAQNVAPMEKQVPAADLMEQALSGPQPKKPVTNRMISPPTLSGGKSPLKDDLAPSLGHAFQAQAVAMDRKAFKRMTRGKTKPDARIDLHGLTLDRAHHRLNQFVMSSHSAGKRLLLVITGKGKHRDDGGPIPVRLGVLRHQVPEWLLLPPLSSVVLQVTQAHQSHGGSGAYYVYLRRAR
jgi:DNA-nicking Smr family endonuclease